jgi:phosphatidylinositol-3-phosphatase
MQPLGNAMTKTLGVSLLALMIAGSANAQQIGDVFYIALENHNWTQPSTFTDSQQIFGNSAAPFINSLVTPGNPNAAQVSYASNYVNVSVGLHPSEPNYVWQEAGAAGPLNDADPYPNNIVNAPNLSAILQNKYGTAGWKSYQEDTDLTTVGGQLTSTVLPQNQWTVPLTRFSGTSSQYTNPYNGSHQYNFAPKHDGQLFFAATNGGNNATPSNQEAKYYAPLQQLSTDLANNTVAKYSWITPDQYNDMHSALATNFTYNGVTYAAGTDAEQIALGDNFLSQIVPLIESSQAFKNNGEIVIWNDETEQPSGSTSATGYTSTEIVISPLAKGNAYTNNIPYTHTNDLATLEAIFGVGGLGAASGTYTMADLYNPGVVAGAVPETSTWAMMAIGFAGLAGAAAFGRRTCGCVAVAG